jgi:hypothetical protein
MAVGLVAAAVSDVIQSAVWIAAPLVPPNAAQNEHDHDY